MSETTYLTADLKTPAGELVGTLVLQYKRFRSGSVGYWAGGKMTLDGRRYQVQAQAVEIGSKARAAETAPA